LDRGSPIVNVRSKEAVSFFTNIIYRFGIPNTIITDNSTQFTGKKFLNFCNDNNTRADWSAVAHPKTNGQVERANGMILQGFETTNLQAAREVPSRMGDRATVHAVKSTYHTVSCHGLHALLHGTWLGSSLAHGHRLW
jgi:transposase InsO family protein